MFIEHQPRYFKFYPIWDYLLRFVDAQYKRVKSFTGIEIILSVGVDVDATPNYPILVVIAYSLLFP